MTAEVIDLAAARARRAERVASKAAAAAKAQPQARPTDVVSEVPRLEKAAELARLEKLLADPEPERADPHTWCVHVRRGGAPGRFLKRTWGSLEAAQMWVEKAVLADKTPKRQM
jgi:hypothetical protein